VPPQGQEAAFNVTICVSQSQLEVRTTWGAFLLANGKPDGHLAAFCLKGNANG